MIFLNGCLGINSEAELNLSTSPEFPIAGEAVAKELSTLNPDEFPALHDWLDRLAKLADQLNVKETE